ncbi:MAG: AAA family ATPase [Nitrososphaerota archaeon]
MRIPELKEYLKTIPTSRSVLLIGPPGVGKSVAVREFAEAEAQMLGLELIDYDDSKYAEIISHPEKYYVYIDLRLTEVEPSDLIGIPRDLDSTVAYKPLTWATVLSKVSRGMCFLDELTNVNRPDVISAAYKIILDRRAGFTKFSDGVRIIAAGNSPEHSAVANLLPAPLVSRFHVVNVEAPTLEEWASWMDAHNPGWDKRGLAYLMRFAEDFLRLPSEPETLDPYPTPRTWTWLLSELPNTDSRHIKERMVGYVGLEVGTRFEAFLRTPLPDPEELIDDPRVFINLSVDAKYLAVVSVANHYVAKLKSPERLLPFLETVSDVQADLVILFLIVAKKKMNELFKIISAKLPKVWKNIVEVGAFIVGL